MVKKRKDSGSHESVGEENMVGDEGGIPEDLELNGDVTEGLNGEMDISTDEEPVRSPRDVDFGELDNALELSRKEAAEYKDRYLRALADLENFKKRAIKERSELLKYQGEAVLGDLLEVVDNLELALAHAEADPESIREGLQMIYNRFVEILAKWQVVGESNVGKLFDPAKYQALSQVYDPKATPGTIINEFKKAYYYKDKMLRHGQVIVAAEPPKGAAEPEVTEESEPEA